MLFDSKYQQNSSTFIKQGKLLFQKDHLKRKSIPSANHPVGLPPSQQLSCTPSSFYDNVMKIGYTLESQKVD